LAKAVVHIKFALLDHSISIMFVLYYFPDNASMAPHLILKELGASYELALVDRDSNAQKSPEYLRLNPLGRIPTLVDKSGPNDIVMFESAAICMHICEALPAGGLMPAIGDPRRPLFLQWMMFLTNTLQAELMPYFYPDRYLCARGSGGTNSQTDGGVDCCAARLKRTHEERVSRILAQLDQHLVTSGGFMIGADVSACDFYLFMLALWTGKFDKPAASYPHLGALLRKLATRSAVQEVCRLENIDLSSLS
jgi:glutathione S-transferase